MTIPMPYDSDAHGRPNSNSVTNGSPMTGQPSRKVFTSPQGERFPPSVKGTLRFDSTASRQIYSITISIHKKRVPHHTFSMWPKNLIFQMLALMCQVISLYSDTSFPDTVQLSNPLQVSFYLRPSEASDLLDYSPMKI